MDDHGRAGVRQLAERLSREYSHVVPPGRVQALVYRTESALLRTSTLATARRLELCETMVRGLVGDGAAVRQFSGAA